MCESGRRNRGLAAASGCQHRAHGGVEVAQLGLVRMLVLRAFRPISGLVLGWEVFTQMPDRMGNGTVLRDEQQDDNTEA